MVLWNMTAWLHANEDDLKLATTDAEVALVEAIKLMGHVEEKLGFSADAPLATAKVSTGLPLFVVNPDEANKNPKASLAEVSNSTHAFVFPVTSGDAVRCLLFMDYDTGTKRWKRGIFGRSNMAKLLVPVLKRWPAASIEIYLLPHTSEFLFSIKTEPKNLTSLVGMSDHTINPQGIQLVPLEDQLQKIGRTISAPDPGK